MKKYFTILFFVLSFVQLNASAVITCDIEAKAVKLTPEDKEKNLTILVQSAKFSGGHSGGKRCPIVKGEEYEIKLSAIDKIKLNKVYSFEFRRVYDFTPENKKVIYDNWELK
jgi:hypothetical protein